MKKVGGTLKLDLAQFRELEAFAQLGTELDATTQSQLDRGYRIVEILKQPQNRPIPVEEQVVTIFAVTKGFMDKVPVQKIREAEAYLIDHFRTHTPELLKSIRDEKVIKDEDGMASKLREVIDTFLKKS
jgi:F-type H+-transporting ATPase subunit alpha